MGQIWDFLRSGSFHKIVTLKNGQNEIVFDRLWYPLSIQQLAALGLGAKLIGPHCGFQVDSNVTDFRAPHRPNYRIKDAIKVFHRKHPPITTYDAFKNCLLDYIVAKKSIHFIVKVVILILLKKETYFAKFLSYYLK